MSHLVPSQGGWQPDKERSIGQDDSSWGGESNLGVGVDAPYFLRKKQARSLWRPDFSPNLGRKSVNCGLRVLETPFFLVY